VSACVNHGVLQQLLHGRVHMCTLGAPKTFCARPCFGSQGAPPGPFCFSETLKQCPPNCYLRRVSSLRRLLVCTGNAVCLVGAHLECSRCLSHNTWALVACSSDGVCVSQHTPSASHGCFAPSIEMLVTSMTVHLLAGASFFGPGPPLPAAGPGPTRTSFVESDRPAYVP
jgi:hypothetical protein